MGESCAQSKSDNAMCCDVDGVRLQSGQCTRGSGLFLATIRVKDGPVEAWVMHGKKDQSGEGARQWGAGRCGVQVVSAQAGEPHSEHRLQCGGSERGPSVM